MKILAVLFLPVACATTSQDPAALAQEAIRNTRAQKSYQTRVKASLAPPKGDRLDYQATGVWVSPGVLHLHYTGSGGRDLKVVRAGKRTEYVCHNFSAKPGKCSNPTCGKELVPQESPNIWVFHPVAGWVPSDAAGEPGAGRGMQNPDEILDVLSRHLGGAQQEAPGVVKATFGGEDIAKVMKEQAQKGAFDWAKSEAAITLHVGPEKRLQRLECRASLVSTDPNIEGRVTYTAEIDVVDYNTTTELKFKDEAGKDVPLSDEIRKAVAEALKEKK